MIRPVTRIVVGIRLTRSRATSATIDQIRLSLTRQTISRTIAAGAESKIAVIIAKKTNGSRLER